MGIGDVVLVILMLAGQTNFDMTLDLSLSTSKDIHTYTCKNIRIRICNVHSVCQLAELEAQAHGRVEKQQQNNIFLKLRLNVMTNGEIWIFRGMAVLRGHGGGKQ